MEQFRHGDLLLVRVDGLPRGVTRDERQGDHRPGVVLAYGEVTGHAHRVAHPTAVLWSSAEGRYLTVADKGTVLTHEEHGRIPLAVGTYQIIRQRVYSPQEVRDVRD